MSDDAALRAVPIPKKLRRCEPDEMEAVYALIQKHANSWTSHVEGLSLAEFRPRLDSCLYFFWEDAKDIHALVVLSSIQMQARSAEMGVISIGAKRHGEALEALRALIDYGFRSLGLHRMWCCVNADNEPCLEMVRKAKVVTQEGILRDARFKEGCFVDQHIFSVLSEEWERHRDRPNPVEERNGR